MAMARTQLFSGTLFPFAFDLQLAGLITDGAWSTMATLPEECRPKKDLIFSTSNGNNDLRIDAAWLQALHGYVLFLFVWALWFGLWTMQTLVDVFLAGLNFRNMCVFSHKIVFLANPDLVTHVYCLHLKCKLFGSPKCFSLDLETDAVAASRRAVHLLKTTDVAQELAFLKVLQWSKMGNRKAGGCLRHKHGTAQAGPGEHGLGTVQI